MIVSIPDFLINAVRVEVPEVTATSVYNVAAYTWIREGKDPDWVDWVDETIEQAFDDREDLWLAIEDLIVQYADLLTEHFESLVLPDEAGLYVTEPVGDADTAVLWKVEE